MKGLSTHSLSHTHIHTHTHTQNKNGTLIARSRSKAHDAQQRTIVNPADDVCGFEAMGTSRTGGESGPHFKEHQHAPRLEVSDVLIGLHS